MEFYLLIKVGYNVLLAIPSFDRGRGDPANLVAVVIEEKFKKFRVATKHGILNRFVKVPMNSTTSLRQCCFMQNFCCRWLERNSIAATKYHSLKASDVTTNAEFALPELVRLGSVGTGQGYRRCSCHQKCSTKRCTCFKNGYMFVTPPVIRAVLATITINLLSFIFQLFGFFNFTLVTR